MNGKEFSTFSRTQQDSHIFYFCADLNELVPTVIRSIFVPVGTEPGFYIAIHRHQKKEYHWILAEYPQFGASIWSRQLKDEVEILSSSELVIYGTFARPWNSKSLIMKAVTEVGCLVSYVSFSLMA